MIFNLSKSPYIRHIIIHIGRHKSGTSSLQHHFHRNKSGLDSRGILYPTTGRGGHSVAHHQFARACDPKISRSADDFNRLRSELLAEIRPHHHTLLISSESFQTLENTVRLKALLRSFKAEVQIVCYFREFADYMMSSFRQATQNQKRFRTFSQFLKHRFKLEKIIAQWQSLGTLRMKWFSSEALVDGDIIADFHCLTGLPTLEILREKQNTSIGGNILFFKLASNQKGIQTFEYNELADIAGRRKRFQKPFFVTRERIDAARKRNDYNDILQKYMGEVSMKYWDQFEPLPRDGMIKEDIEFIKSLYPHIHLKSFEAMLEEGRDWF